MRAVDKWVRGAFFEGFSWMRCRFAWGEVSFAELLLYNMRHVQEIAAQLSLFLGERGVPVPDFVPTARNSAA
jgi:hypothetical protein